MIYRVNRTPIQEETVKYPLGSVMDSQIKGAALQYLDNSISDDDFYVYEVAIPRAYARMETKQLSMGEKAFEVEHFSIYIVQQLGTVRIKRDAIVLVKFPYSDRLFKVTLYYNGGIEYSKEEHKYFLRESKDELDRRIINGFCAKYDKHLFEACHQDPYYGPDYYLLRKAAMYNHKMMPLRIKHGERGIRYYPVPDPLDEGTNIFANLAFI